MSVLNLAGEPFLNRRPVERLRLVLWVLGLVLLVLNVTSYLRNRADSTGLREELRALETEIEAVDEDVVDLQATLRTLDPQRQNNRVFFLNQQIAERTFPWGDLFDDIGDLLPPGVRLRSLSPQAGRQRRGRTVDREAAEEPRRVALSVAGVAKGQEPLYDLVDGLFAHPRFDRPKLNHERSQDDGNLTFTLNSAYLPAASIAASDPVGAEAEVDPESGAAGESAPPPPPAGSDATEGPGPEAGS